MDWQKLLGATLLATLLIVAMTTGGSLQAFVSPVAVLVTTLGSLAAWGLLSGRALPALRSTLAAPSPSPAELAAALVTARTGSRAVWGVTKVVVLVHLAMLLNNIDNPAALGPVMAILLLGPLYAFLLDSTLLGTLQHAVIQKAADQGIADVVLDTAGAVQRPPAARQRPHQQQR